MLGLRRAHGRGRPPTERRRRLAVVAVGAAILVSGSAVAAGLGVSPTPFGTPTAEVTDPGRNIDAVRGDRLWAWTEQTRSEVLARRGVVATSQPLAAQAGLEMLRKGGTAADAAVATAAMLGLVEPHSAGIGGDMEAIYWSAKDRKLSALNAAGWAPSAWTPEYFTDKGLTEVPTYGVDSVSVPGAVDGWSRFQKRFGKLSLADALKPSISLARQGFGLTERIRGDWNSYDQFYVDMLREDPESNEVFLRDGQVPPLYSIFRNPHLARAYELLARRGPDAFYRGPIGRAIVDRIQAGGGAMTMSDLSSFRSEWVKPISTSYKGYDVYETPPQTQGFATLEMLNIIEQCAPRVGYDLQALGAKSPQFWHILIEAKKLAYADLLRYNGDPRFVDVPLDRLLSKGYAASLCDQHRSRPRGGSGERREGAEPHGPGEGRHGVSRRRRPLGQHGVVHLLDLRLLRRLRVGARLRVPAQRPRVVLLARPIRSGRGRPAQAPVPDHHPGVRDEGRRAAAGVRQHGR